MKYRLIVVLIIAVICGLIIIEHYDTWFPYQNNLPDKLISGRVTYLKTENSPRSEQMLPNLLAKWEIDNPDRELVSFQLLWREGGYIRSHRVFGMLLYSVEKTHPTLQNERLKSQYLTIDKQLSLYKDTEGLNAVLSTINQWDSSHKDNRLISFNVIYTNYWLKPVIHGVLIIYK